MESRLMPILTPEMPIHAQLWEPLHGREKYSTSVYQGSTFHTTVFHSRCQIPNLYYPCPARDTESKLYISLHRVRPLDSPTTLLFAGSDVDTSSSHCLIQKSTVHGVLSLWTHLSTNLSHTSPTAQFSVLHRTVLNCVCSTRQSRWLMCPCEGGV